MSNISASANTSGQQLLTAALAKGSQEQEGKMALALIEAAVASAPAAPTSSSTASLGSHVNIKI